MLEESVDTSGSSVLLSFASSLGELSLESDAESERISIIGSDEVVEPDSVDDGASVVVASEVVSSASSFSALFTSTAALLELLLIACTFFGVLVWTE